MPISLGIKSNKFVTTVQLRRSGEDVKIRKATMHRDDDTGDSYYTYDSTISSRALVTNVSGWQYTVYPYGRAFEGDYMMVMNPDTPIEEEDRVIYDGKEYQVTEWNNRDDFLELVVERI